MKSLVLGTPTGGIAVTAGNSSYGDQRICYGGRGVFYAFCQFGLLLCDFDHSV
jgi:hypothetical protein